MLCFGWDLESDFLSAGILDYLLWRFSKLTNIKAVERERSTASFVL